MILLHPVSNFFEQSLFRLLQNPPRSVQQFASQFASAYDTGIALTASPTPITVGKSLLMAQVLVGAFSSQGGSPSRAVSGIIQGLTVFWPGVVVPGGAVTGFLGGAALQSCLISNLSNSRISHSDAARKITQCMKAATRLVQYVIPPAGPAFLIVA